MGRLVLSPCTTRLDDFLFGADVDVTSIACTDICTQPEAALAIQPTTTDLDPVAAPRPWLERVHGQTNLPAGTAMDDAVRCLMPQGVNGCGFESPLEAMYLALTRAQDPSDPSYGFLRRSALLAVVFLTDEADCSANPDYATIFAADGGQVFWSDPNASFPTSAVCWNAGVECFGDPSNYEGCIPANKGVDGAVGVADDQAVLYPVSRYVELLAAIEAEKQELDPDREVLVSLIGGVDASGQAHYAVADDPDKQDSFGIGPGCMADDPNEPDYPVYAVPPVRLRALVDTFSPGAMYSICEGSYASALEEVADAIRDQITPGCFDACVADSDPSTASLVPECEVEENSATLGNAVMPECLRDANGYVVDPDTNAFVLPDDADRCSALRRASRPRRG